MSSPRARPDKQVKPVSRNTSTPVRVVPPWGVPSPGQPLWVVLAVDEERWTGYTFRLTYEAGELVALEVRKAPGAARLGAQDLQRVPLGALDREARRYVSGYLTDWEASNAPDARWVYPGIEDWLDEMADPPRESDLELARLCADYIRLNGKSGWRHILARKYGKDPSGIQTIISRARRRRFLTPVAQGQYGGQLMPKALRLLAPPKRQAAWERLTDEQRAEIAEREQLRSDLQAHLLEEVRAGRIDQATWARLAESVDDMANPTGGRKAELRRRLDELRASRSTS